LKEIIHFFLIISHFASRLQIFAHEEFNVSTQLHVYIDSKPTNTCSSTC